MTLNDICEDLNQRIKEIHKKILNGEINLLDLELVPYFNELKDSVTVLNLEKSSETYKNACLLLNQKFEELMAILNSLESQEKFLTYLKSNPTDVELYDLIHECWRDIFTIDSLSLEFLELSQKRLSIDRGTPIIIEHLDKNEISDDFLLEIPKRKFTEKMMKFYDSIIEKLPCKFEEIFKGEKNQQKIYENFVYLLHLLQLGKLKYLKETNTVYI